MKALQKLYRCSSQQKYVFWPNNILCKLHEMSFVHPKHAFMPCWIAVQYVLLCSKGSALQYIFISLMLSFSQRAMSQNISLPVMQAEANILQFYLNSLLTSVCTTSPTTPKFFSKAARWLCIVKFLHIQLIISNKDWLRKVNSLSMDT